VCGTVNQITNVHIKEWLGFNFGDYLGDILNVVSNYEFPFLRAKSKKDREIGLLDSNQIRKMRGVFEEQFKRGGTIGEISKDLLNKVGLPNRIVMRNGKKIREIDKRFRAINVARTETTTIANLGSERNYSKNGISQYVWVATMGSDRTCPICRELDAKIFDVGKGRLPPAHSLCRCTIIPKTELQ